MRYSILTSLIPFLSLGMVVIANSAVAESKLARIEVTDHFKQVYHKTPHNVEVCYDKTVSGDKTGDALMGAIIGGIIGNNVGDIENGGALGAVVGGMLGHNNSNATGGVRTVCKQETRYTEERRTVYSHSTVTFTHDGKSYTLRFQK